MSRQEPDVEVKNLVLERISTSGKAWLCRKAADLMHEHEFWLPTSQVLDSSMQEPGDEGYVLLPHWLAKEKDLLG